MRIIVLGYIVRGPMGGLAWHHLQYVLGLKQMGHDVLFLEDSDDYACCYNPETFESSTDPKYGLNFLKKIFDSCNLRNNWAYYDDHTGSWNGQSKMEVLSFCRSADLVINLSGVNPLRDWWTSVPIRILVDTDPAFTQIKHLTDNKALEVARAHTHFATFGENFGKSMCSIPDDGFSWQPTRQPLCIDLWNVSAPHAQANWTTVMQWDSYRQAEYAGKVYGMKSLSFSPFISLPGLTNEKLELALGSPNAPGIELMQQGWLISDPLEATLTPRVFQKYIANSKGEWSVAKHGYVMTKSGWFSERTLNYMASGKPVVIQDTGLSDIIPDTGGVLIFSNINEAKEQIERVNADYAMHCRQARKVAAHYFESGKVLQSLLSIANA